MCSLSNLVAIVSYFTFFFSLLSSQVFVVQGNDTTVARVTDNYDGTYGVDFSVTKAGKYVVSSLLSGLHLKGSPFQFTVTPGSVKGDLSKVQGADIKQAPAGKGGTIRVQAVDGSGNPLTGGLGPDAVREGREGGWEEGEGGCVRCCVVGRMRHFVFVLSRDGRQKSSTARFRV